MSDPKRLNLNRETIEQLGLQKSSKSINAQIAPEARIFEYPSIENVYVMESDLYGNPMPEGSCFLAFEGRAGLIGKHIRIEELRSSSLEDIRRIVQENGAG
jgi:hypothetical protein